jgi:hypothetical protein
MKIERIICDNCGEEIPKEKKKDIFGIEREYYKFGKFNYGYPFKDIDCRRLGMELCEKCVDKINSEMLSERLQYIKQSEIEY